jgi:hypothetical protein
MADYLSTQVVTATTKKRRTNTDVAVPSATQLDGSIRDVTLSADALAAEQNDAKAKYMQPKHTSSSRIGKSYQAVIPDFVPPQRTTTSNNAKALAGKPVETKTSTPASK